MKILEPQRLRKVEWWEYAERFLFGCVISAGAAIAGEVLGSRVAGALLAFPAILPASLTLTDKKEGHSAAAQQDVGALFGGVGLVAFALVVRAVARGWGGWGLAAGVAAWIFAALGCYALFGRRVDRLEHVPRASGDRTSSAGAPTGGRHAGGG